MYLVPALLAVDALDPATAERIVDVQLRGRALHVDRARRLSPMAAALAEYELRVYADGIELAPARPTA